MYLRRIALAATLAGAVFSTAAYAHHSVTGVFDPENRIEWTGVITKIDWINPHIYIHLDVTDEDGKVTQWQLETAPPAMLQKGGLTSAKIMDGGSVVTIDGIRARDQGLNRGFIYKITYGDGHFYQLGAPSR